MPYNTEGLATLNLDRAARSTQALSGLNLYDPEVLKMLQGMLGPLFGAQRNQFFTDTSALRSSLGGEAGQAAGAQAAYSGHDPSSFMTLARKRTSQDLTTPFFQGLAGLSSDQQNLLMNALTGNQQFRAQNLSGAIGSYQNIANTFESRRQFDAGQQSFLESLIPGLIQGGASLGSAAILASDRRLKRDIKKLTERSDGIGIYSFRYKWSDTTHIGVMADEVRLVKPEAVGTSCGYDYVNYGML